MQNHNWAAWFINEVKIAINEYCTKDPLILREIYFSKKLGHEVCVIQIRGKQIFPEIDPRFIFNNPQILECFCKKDVAAITAMAVKLNNDVKESRYKLIELPAESSENPNIVTILELGKGTYKNLNIDHIDQNESLKDRFTSSDAMIIATHKARLDYASEDKAMRLAKLDKCRSRSFKSIIKIIK